MNSFVVAAMAILLMTVSGCKKNDIEVEPGANGLPFVGKRLMLSSFIMDPAVDFDGDGKLDPDLMFLLRDCDKDNIIIFEKGGQLGGENGAKRCDDDGPTEGNAGAWTYDEKTKMLRIVDADDKNEISEWKVVEASSKLLKVEIEEEEDGEPVKIVMTWKAV
ncbi:hypothetical protein DR864_09230 [Runella rosea]|uniref:Lipocalin-like domain-containing protein n=1 Tax=Runella rosea TaxID=2259595 RepID=A0A344TGX9_9BACT|nr:hypothetical protein [Runella rosea]AXE17900.1 hypothetical protein DR864_09230 [Runella rosea]